MALSLSKSGNISVSRIDPGPGRLLTGPGWDDRAGTAKLGGNRDFMITGQRYEDAQMAMGQDSRVDATA